MYDAVKSIDYLKTELTKIIRRNKYIAKSEYAYLLPEIKKTSDFFNALIYGGVLGNFCDNNKLDLNSILRFIEFIDKIEDNIDEVNNEFIEKSLVKEKDFFDKVLYDIDPNVQLDDEQRKVALTDEDYCLVIAGAGAGKTTTIAAKIKYLVEKLKVKPEDILVISFTNEAVKELQDKINKKLKLPCVISTFHSAGNYVIKKESVKPLKIAREDQIYFVLQEYFKEKVLQNKSLTKNLVIFFSEYFDAPYNGENMQEFFRVIAGGDYSTLKQDLEFKDKVIKEKTKKQLTILNEKVRSYEEVKIANFLYLNGIEYEYEPVYEYLIDGTSKTYTPDFRLTQGDKQVYLEHFGIGEDGKSNLYNEDELNLYKKAIKDKVALHKKHGTKLLYTFSYYKDRRDLLSHLREGLLSNGFVFNPMSEEEVLKKIIDTEENRYIKKAIYLIINFINAFKTNGFTSNVFQQLYLSTENIRNRLLIDVCRECYDVYQQYLNDNNMIDFQDMINLSSQVLRKFKNDNLTIPYKYIFIDEYQDISLQRFNFINELHKVCNAKVVAVGDDWQSIFAFSGADVDLFTDFEQIFGYAKKLYINHTYRNSQELIDIAGKFVQANPKQLKKKLISEKHVKDPVVIFTYDDRAKNIREGNFSGSLFQAASVLDDALVKIVEYAKKEKRNPFKERILILGRYNFDAFNLQRSGLFSYDSESGILTSNRYPKLNLHFKTAHGSKGLTFDDVIIVNCRNETYGFPSKVERDPVFSLVLKEDKAIAYAEERRLFYVALTRTKNRVFLLAPEHAPSDFVIEIKKNNKNVVQIGDMNLNYKPAITYSECPICHFPLQKRFKKAVGLDLWICSNEPELCSFMTNNLNGGKLSICKCDKCNTGYLIVKKGDGDCFLGCTNFKRDGTGCSRTISKKNYYAAHGYEYTPDDIIKTTHYKEDDDTIRTNVSKDGFDEVQPDKLSPIYYNNVCLNEVVYNVLHSLYEINYVRFIGRSVLVNFLKGNNHEYISKYKLYNLSDFGCLKDVDFELINQIVDWLIAGEFILESNNGMYKVLYLTHKGIYYDVNITCLYLDNLKEALSKQSDSAWAYFE